MKVIQINTVCGTGSTGKIAADICRLGTKQSIDMYCAYGRGTAPDDILGYKIGNQMDFVSHVLVNFIWGKNGFASKTVTKKFIKWLDKQQPDIIHLHNIHGFYLHIELLFNYIKERDIPVIWTFHDCWPLTGHCAYFDYAKCNKWTSQCYDCPIYRSDYPYSLLCDNSYNNFLSKKSCFNGVSNLTIVTPSQWLADIVKKSYLKDYPCKVIFNGINLELFSPQNKYAIASSHKIILGVANVWAKRKGIHDFYQLADILPSQYKIVLIGVNKQQKKYIEHNYSSRILPIMYTNNQQELAQWYSQAYAYVNPTYEDNFPTTNLEALACGTPVITYDTGGSPESLDSSCGIVVEKGNVKALAEAILSLDFNHQITSDACRRQSLCYDRFLRFQEYIELYKDVLQSKGNGHV